MYYIYQMAAIITALDTYTPRQTGENGHVQYGWSNDIKERIVQFSFQVTRTDKSQLSNLETVLDDILTVLKNKVESTSVAERTVGLEFLTVLYKMIGQTRDIIDGKGECALAYMMIYAWYSFNPVLAFFALRCLVDFGDEGKTHQYGSWKDLKYFCEYCKSKGAVITHPLIQHSIQLINEQLRKDIVSTNPSLVSKWVPREKSTFGWLFTPLACQYFSSYIETAKTATSVSKATLKCKTEYRKLLSSLNKKLDTLQIKQCGKEWAQIDFNHVTSVSISKQKKAFLNKTKENTDRSLEQDRIDCAEHYREHIQKGKNGEVVIKGKRVGMENFTAQALRLLEVSDQAEIDTLNLQWNDNATQTGALGKFVAMVDVSGSMSGDPMNAAIALGIRVAEKSALGRRVLTFSSNPTWCNLDGVNTFVGMVRVLQRADWGQNTNFYAALDMILNAIVDAKLTPEEVEGMVLAVFSDMQMDEAGSYGGALYDNIVEKYEKTGIRLHGKAFQPPHILFWNLRSGNGFPTLSTQKNVSMLSGFSPSLLNLFCEQGIDALQDLSPWNTLIRGIEKERYNIMGYKIAEVIVI
jgi:hypothetical protein